MTVATHWICVVQWITASDNLMSAKCVASSEKAARHGATAFALSCGYRTGMGQSVHCYSHPDVAAAHRAWKRGTGMK